ncbi:MAG: hypothetical protein HYU68_03830 [Bacteroidetes bacterium]|nr:hypothetical protein [Bacteroidota bacterium]
MKKTHFTKLPLPEPKRAENLPKKAQWLAGEGAGSWFYITKAKNDFVITRFSPEGKIECTGIFECIHAEPFNINNAYQFTHLSHCKTVNIIQNSVTFTFERI